MKRFSNWEADGIALLEKSAMVILLPLSFLGYNLPESDVKRRRTGFLPSYTIHTVLCTVEVHNNVVFTKADVDKKVARMGNRAVASKNSDFLVL